MSFLRDLLPSKTNRSELDTDIKRDIEAVEKFLKLFEEKVNGAKRVIKLWEKGKIPQIEEAETFVSEIPSMNRKIQKRCGAVINDGRLVRLLRKLVREEINRNVRAIPTRSGEITSHLRRIHIYFMQLLDNLSFLKKILLSQSLYLSRQGNLSQIVRDLESHQGFYILLRDEAEIDLRIKQNVSNIVRENQLFLGIKKYPGGGGQRIERDIEELIKRKRVEDITNPFGINFRQFHDEVYVPNFPDPEERDPVEWMQTYLSPTFKRNSVQRRKSHTHLIVAKIGEEVIGGLVGQFVGCEEDICFGVIWFLVVAKDKRTRGVGTFLIERIRNILERDAIALGYTELYGIFEEVNDPSQMTSEQIDIDKRDSMDPTDREKYWKKRGYHVIEFNYEQPPAFVGMKPVTYVNLRCFPINSEWKRTRSIQSNVFRIIMRNFIVKGIENIDPDKEPTCVRMLTDIESMEKIRILV